MPKKEKRNPKSQTTKRLLRLWRRQSVDLRQPQEDQHCPAHPPKVQEVAKGRPDPFSCQQVPAAGAQSWVSAPHSPCCPHNPSPVPLAAHALGRQQTEAVPAGPQTKKGALAKEEGERELCRIQELRPREAHSEQERSEGKLNGHPELPLGEESSNRRPSNMSCYCVTIRTVWVNPQYAELFRNFHTVSQDRVEATAPSDSCEEVPAASSQSQVSTLHSSYSCFSTLSSCSSTLLSSQTLSEQQDLHRLQPSRSRKALQTLCRVCSCSCIAAQSED